MKIEDYFKYYIQGSDHYLIPKDIFIELFNEMVNWKEENQKQKDVIKKIMYKIENYTTLNEPRIRKELLDILNEVE